MPGSAPTAPRAASRGGDSWQPTGRGDFMAGLGAFAVIWACATNVVGALWLGALATIVDPWQAGVVLLTMVFVGWFLAPTCAREVCRGRWGFGLASVPVTLGVGWLVSRLWLVAVGRGGLPVEPWRVGVSALAAVVGGAVFVIGVRREAFVVTRYRRLARRLATDVVGDPSGALTLAGSLDGCRVSVCRVEGDDDRPTTVGLSVTAPASGLPRFLVQKRGVFTAISKAMGTREVLTGDEAFDARVRVLPGRVRRRPDIPRSEIDRIRDVLTKARRDVAARFLVRPERKLVVGGGVTLSDECPDLAGTVILERIRSMVALARGFAEDRFLRPSWANTVASSVRNLGDERRWLADRVLPVGVGVIILALAALSAALGPSTGLRSIEDAKKVFPRVWDMGISKVQRVAVPSASATLRRRLTARLRALGWQGERPPLGAASGPEWKDGHAHLTFPFENGTVITAWTRAGGWLGVGSWGLLSLTIRFFSGPLCLDERARELMTAWNAENPDRVCDLFPPKHRDVLRRQLENRWRHRRWRARLVTYVTSSSDEAEHATLVFALTGGDAPSRLITRWRLQDGAWWLHGLKPQ